MAWRIHGLSRKELERKGAIDWTRGASGILANFLNEHPDLPIVAHGIKHDYYKVLRPAFQRVDNLMDLPKAGRWRCTIDLADRLPKC